MKDLITVELKLDEDENLLRERVAKKAGLRGRDFKFTVVKKSIDARKKNDIKFVYNVVLGEKEPRSPEKKAAHKRSAIVVGAGPAGLFCALTLARAGVKPIVFERGESVDKRSKTVRSFFDGGELNEESNVQFGEGGAGAFSDGKLNTQVNNEVIDGVLSDFVYFGAPEDVGYLSKPHVGSDNLPKVVKNIRKEIEHFGGEFLFNRKADDLIIENGVIKGVASQGEKFFADYVVLAIGHSARDTFSMLDGRGVFMEGKDFAVGFRIEQLQETINKDRYGKFFNNQKLGAADYKLVSHASERATFTFCMCPGGQVIAAASEKGLLCVNGMSNYARDMINANSAVICQVGTKDFGGGALGGVKFQKRIERAAFELGGGDYRAPVQLAEDFICGRKSDELRGVEPSYPRGVKLTDLSKLYPSIVTTALKSGLKEMDARLQGFASSGAVLTGVETRSSSPVRVTRTEKFESVNVKRLYPCGEGCGYAGGITSAAADGVKVARAIIADINSDR